MPSRKRLQEKRQFRTEITSKSFAFVLLIRGAIAVTGCFAIAFSGNSAFAQIIPDHTLGNENSTVEPITPTVDQINGGATRGDNLFHSFQEFNVGNGRSVYFTNPVGIENILSRVTGSNPSNIFGKLGVNGNANLFLINPNGIIFGLNAQLEISGSFFASTASSFKFLDGNEFSATNPQAPPLLTVNITPGLQWGASTPEATITNRGNLAPGQDLTLVADKLNLQGQLQAGRDLTLLAQDTVKVRDEAANPFIASSGRKLLLQGNQGVDIFVLNHPGSGLFSGGDMVLRSANTVVGDAHFVAGRNFRVEQLDGSLGSLSSPHDPVFEIAGDYSVASYSGGSLQIIAGGAVNIPGNVTITSAGSAFNNSTVILSDGTPLSISGTTRPTLDVRSGASEFFGIPTPAIPGTPTSADINIGTIKVSAPDGLVFLTNQYSPNPSLSGGVIQVGQLDTSSTIGNGGSLVIDSRSDINLGNNNNTSSIKTGTVAFQSNGGTITLNASNSINVTIDLDSSSKAGAGNAGNGGAITLTASNGINFITAQSALNTLYSSSHAISGNAGNGGAITLTAFNGSIIGGNLYSNSRAESGNAGNGGDITLTASNGSIRPSGIDSSSRNQSGNAGNGGDINLTATNGGIRLFYISSRSATSNGNAGNGGAIILSTFNGNIGIGDVSSRSSVLQSGNAGNGGAIILTATNGNIGTSFLISASSAKNGDNAGNGGDISLTATSGYITTSSLISSGSSRSGNILINAPDGAFSLSRFYGPNGIIYTSTSGAGKSGDIEITARSVSLTSGTQVSTSTSSQGAGGNLTVRASDFVELSGESRTHTGLLATNDGLFAVPGNPFDLPPGQQLNGYIPPATFVQAFGDIQFPTGLFTQTSSAANAGKLTVETGQLIIRDGATIAATTFGSGNAGNISVKANDVSITNGSILSGVGPGARGNSGKIDIQTSSLNLKQEGIIQTLTLGPGNAGNIQVTATDNINISGVSPTQGFSSGLLSGTEGTDSGQGGNINVTTPILRVSDGAVLSAKTLNSSRGGDITVNVSTLEATGGGQLLTTAFNSGQAGDIQVNATDIITLSGSDPTFTNRSAQFGSAFVNPDSPASGFSARTEGAGAAGNLRITTGVLTIQNNSQVAVTSQGTTNSGNLEVTANSIFLNNQGALISFTAGGEGGNINLQVRDNINLRHNSLISAEALGTGNGGNIKIDTDGFVLAIISEDSDIVANAYQGQGGSITGKAAGIFGFRQFIDHRTPESDFTASSKIGIDGTVDVKVENRPVTTLPAQFVDRENLINRRCQTHSTPDESRFIITGRGGLQTRPGDPFPSPYPTGTVRSLPSRSASSDTPVGSVINPSQPMQLREAVPTDRVRLNSGAETSLVTASNHNSTTSTPVSIVEAKGWIRGPNGEIILTAQVPTVTPHSSWSTLPTCSGLQK